MIPLLTPDEVRALGVETPIGDSDLAFVLAGITSEIERVAGPLEDVSETRLGGSRVIILARPAAAIVRIREFDQDDDLVDDDFRLDADRRSIWRLGTGTTPRPYWWGPVLVDFAPWDNYEERRLIAVKMLQMHLTGMPGVLGFTEGNWSIQFKTGETWSTTRADILGSIEQPWHFG